VRNREHWARFPGARTFPQPLSSGCSSPRGVSTLPTNTVEAATQETGR
jgi:hypothetical protein